MNMKYTYLVFVFFTLIISGCQHPEIDISPNNDKAEFIVKLDIPGTVQAKTKAVTISGEMIDNLYVLVFDKNGVYQSRHEGNYVSGTVSSANYRFADIPVTKGGERLFFHFIANYDWSSFSDANHLGKSEAEVINQLTVSSGMVAYWQRIGLPDGLAGNKNTTISLTEDVRLLRNIAKVSVINLTNEQGAGNYLTDVSFGIGCYIDRGTVAPYSTKEYEFKAGAVTEALDGNLIHLTDESELIQAQNGLSGGVSQIKNIYERKNSKARNQTYIIIKGYFQNTPTINNTSVPSYYKVDIVDSYAANQLLDIERNHHYVVKINDVAMAGYPTFKEAVDNPASNNVNAAMQVAEYTSVSDGIYVLEIEKAVYSFVESNQEFQIKYSYYDVATRTRDNSSVNITLEQDPLNPVIIPSSFSYADGVISAKTAIVPANRDIYQATITLSANNYLSRKITVRFRKPMDFVNVSVTPSNGSIPSECYVAEMVGQSVTITFAFPSDISPSVFPLPVYIYSQKLSPDPTKMGIDALSIDPLPNNTYRYVYMAPYKGNENSAPVSHTIYLTTSTPLTNENVSLKADYFNPSIIRVKSKNIPALDNVLFTPVIKREGEPVTLSFSIPEVPDKTLPYKIRIHTDYLAFDPTASDNTGLDCVWDDVLGVYVYKTNTAGAQKIKFKTNRGDSDEYVRIDGDRFASTTVRRSILSGEFKDVSVSIANSVIGSPVNINFSFDEVGKIYVENGIDVRFITKYLTPASGSGIVSTGNQNEYKMEIIPGSDTYQAQFALNSSLPIGYAELINITGTDMKNTSVNLNIPGKYVFGSDITGYANRPVLTNGFFVPLSFSSLGAGLSFYLHFSIPEATLVNGAPVSATNPLFVLLECTKTVLISNDSYGIDMQYPSGLMQPATAIWFKITRTGSKYVKLSNDRANDTETAMTLKSVSDMSGTTDNGIFELAAGFQDK